MQGTWVASMRPKTKKALKVAIEQAPETVALEATSLFGNEYDGPITDAPAGEYYIVGPDPYTKRTWYATIRVEHAHASPRRYKLS